MKNIYTGRRGKRKYKTPRQRKAKAIYEKYRTLGYPRGMAFEMTQKEMKKR